MEHRRGVQAGVAAFLIWGLAPMFWNGLRSLPPDQALAWRVLWSLPLLVLVISVRRRWPVFRKALASRRTILLAIVSGALLCLNWSVFIWAVTSGRIVEASLGYFINPLVSIALGVIVLRERLRLASWVAIAVAAVGVGVMAAMADGALWVSLVLAFSFAFYGLLKKGEASPPPVEGLLIEMCAVALPLTIYLATLVGTDAAPLEVASANGLLIPMTGVITVVPLLLFGGAAQRIPLSTLGLLQYLAPSMQLVSGVLLYGETLDAGEMIGFPLVWIALVIFSVDSIRGVRMGRVPR